MLITESDLRKGELEPWQSICSAPVALAHFLHWLNSMEARKRESAELQFMHSSPFSKLTGKWLQNTLKQTHTWSHTCGQNKCNVFKWHNNTKMSAQTYANMHSGAFMHGEHKHTHTHTTRSYSVVPSISQSPATAGKNVWLATLNMASSFQHPIWVSYHDNHCVPVQAA